MHRGRHGTAGFIGVFEQGAVLFPDLEVRAAERPGYAPPAWKGVFLKDLVTGKETGGAFELPPHACRAELRDPRLRPRDAVVVERGRRRHGFLRPRGRAVPVQVGQTFVTPPRVHHAVSAGDVEISLLAIFVPALG